MGCESPSDAIEQAICDIQRQDQIDRVLQAALEDDQALVQTEARNNLQEEREAWEKIRATIQIIWPQERNFLHSYFWIPYDSVEAVHQIEEIQRQLGQDIDGIVWPWTLREIYIQIYSRNLNILPEFQRNRWEAYQEMQEYRNNPRIIDGERLYVSQIPDVFNDRIYWWGTRENREIFRPQEWTMFAEWLLGDGFDINARNTPNSVQIFRIWWRNALALYDSQWRAISACYTSPWEDSHTVRGSHVLNTSWNYQMHHLSRDHGNAPMAYGVNVQDRAFWIMIHAWVWKITWYDESSGCFRIGIWYARFIYNYITQNTTSYTINVNI